MRKKGMEHDREEQRERERERERWKEGRGVAISRFQDFVRSTLSCAVIEMENGVARLVVQDNNTRLMGVQPQVAHRNTFVCILHAV